MVMLFTTVSCSFGCIDAQQVQSMVCELAPSGGVRREDAVQSAGSGSHFFSESCLSFTWLLLLAVGILLRICEGVA